MTVVPLHEAHSRPVLAVGVLLRAATAAGIAAIGDLVLAWPVPAVPVVVPYVCYLVLAAAWPTAGRRGKAAAGVAAAIVVAGLAVRYGVTVAAGIGVAVVLAVLYGYVPPEPRIERVVGPLLRDESSSSSGFGESNGDDSPRTVAYTPPGSGSVSVSDDDERDSLPCPACGLSLDAHLAGEFCPNCGRPVSDVVPATRHQLGGLDSADDEHGTDTADDDHEGGAS